MKLGFICGALIFIWDDRIRDCIVYDILTISSFSFKLSTSFFLFSRKFLFTSMTVLYTQAYNL
jgi:hypothetical protein